MNEDWTDAELMAAMTEYKRMANFEAKKIKYSKREVFRRLAASYGRSEKAFEYRMQNISAVLDELGKSWIPGLKPASNVGSNVKERIRNLLSDWSDISVDSYSAPYKKKLPAMRSWLIEVAKSKTPVTYQEVMEVFDLDRFSLRHAMDILGHESENRDEPIITALIVNKKTRRCSEGLASEFEVYDDQRERESLYDFWRDNPSSSAFTNDKYYSDDPEVRAARFVSVEARPDQAAFRRRVFWRCQQKCVISGCNIVEALDAAHIHGRDWRLGHNSADDGYLLRKDLHALYDKGLLQITESGEIKLSDSIKQHYGQYQGKLIEKCILPSQ